MIRLRLTTVGIKSSRSRVGIKSSRSRVQGQEFKVKSSRSRVQGQELGNMSVPLSSHPAMLLEAPWRPLSYCSISPASPSPPRIPSLFELSQGQAPPRSCSLGRSPQTHGVGFSIRVRLRPFSEFTSSPKASGNSTRISRVKLVHHVRIS